MSARKLNILQWYIAFCLLLLAVDTFSQNTFSSEDALKKEANKLFEDGDFAKAYPLFSQLLSVYSKDPQYNYKFGTCLLFASKDKGKAIPYIEFAAKRQKQDHDIDKEVFFYLGRAYHLNYRFADAIKSYNTFKEIASSKQVEKLDVDRQIEMCKNGMQLLKNITDLSVLEKKEVPIADFFRSYNLSAFNAKLITKPDELKTSIDKKKKDESLIYLAPNQNRIYYSSYGEDGKNGRDIYYVTRTGSGDLSAPTHLSDVINTKYDEDFVFLHPGGKILYFCSKGHNSMGGYDIFKSKWDDKTKLWGKPVNMDFAINTPDDDILFISDADDKTAYFSSKRESADGYIEVYKIKLQRKPLNLAIVKGTLKKEVGDQIAKATITVTRAGSNEVVGVFHTNPADGSYTLNLPNGGNFIFSIESEGFNKLSEDVTIPSQKEIKPLKQSVELTNTDGENKILINNEFDAQVDSTDTRLAIQYIKEKASLNVSPPEEDTSTAAIPDTNVTESITQTNPGKQKGEIKSAVTNFTNNDIINIAYQDAKETQQDANDFRRNSDAAHKLSKQKKELSLQKNDESLELMKTAETIANQKEKTEQQDRATKLKKESDELSKESVISLTLANQMDTLAKAKQIQADNELRYAKDLESAIKSRASESQMNALLARKEALNKNSDVLSATFPPDMSQEINDALAEANKSKEKYTDAVQNVNDLDKEAKRLHAAANNEKDEAVKKNLNRQAEEMDKETAIKKKEVEKYKFIAKHKQEKSDSLKSSVEITTSVMKEIHLSTGTNITASAGIVKPDIEPIQEDSDTAKIARKTSDLYKQPATSNNNTLHEKNTDTTASVPIIAPDYTEIFAGKRQVAEKETNELKKADALAMVYQSWADSLDHQVIILRNRLKSTTGTEEKTSIENKMQELKALADEKRQKAADNRNKSDNLKLQAALAEASTITPENDTDKNTTITAKTNKTTTQNEANAQPTITTNTTSDSSANNLSGVENIDKYFSEKLKANETNTNEAEKKYKNQVLYENWASSLHSESLRIQKSGNTDKAQEVEQESKIQEAIALKLKHEINHTNTVQTEAVPTNSVNAAETKTETSIPSDKTGSIKTEAAKNENTITKTNPTQSDSATQSNPVNHVLTTNSSPKQAQQQSTSGIQTHAITTQTTTPAIPLTNVPDTIKNKSAYTHFITLKSESDQAKKNSEILVKQANDFQQTSDQAFNESKNISHKMAQTQNRNEKQKLKEQSDALDMKSLKYQAKADSVKVIARNAEAEANAKSTEADLYLQSLDKAAYEEIVVATSSKANANATISNQSTPTTTSTKDTLLANTTTNTTVKNPTSENRTQTDKTASANKQEVLNAKEGTANTKNEKSENNHEVSATTVNNTISSATEDKTSTYVPPWNSAKMKRYYEALLDKIEPEGASYSATNPIPVNPPLPEGLIFKVQIGAFRNPIPQSIFKGMRPISAETTSMGLMRYTAGLFTNFSSANNAKNQVHRLGYRDAFVVAFYNGKRISLNEALSKAKDQGGNNNVASSISGNTKSGNNISSSKNTTTNTVHSTIDNISNGTTTNTENNVSEAGSPDNSSAVVQIAKATDVKSVSGLFYTIQIGVFSKPVTSVQLYNISPLNSEVTDNGLIRYTTGRFDDELKAINAKNKIAAKGISDAFVVAYRDGKRIPLVSAKSIIDVQGKKVLTKEKQEDTFISTVNTATSSTNTSNATIVFKVQIGAFKEQIPIDVANKLLANAGKGVSTYKDSNGLLLYTIGEFNKYESANALKSQLISEGFPDAFVIVFVNGKKISSTEAMELMQHK